LTACCWEGEVLDDVDWTVEDCGDEFTVLVVVAVPMALVVMLVTLGVRRPLVIILDDPVGTG
jgi:hypothetical protein